MHLQPCGSSTGAGWSQLASFMAGGWCWLNGPRGCSQLPRASLAGVSGRPERASQRLVSPLITLRRPKPVTAKPRGKGQSGQNKAGQSRVWTQGHGCDHLESVDFPNGERFLQAVVLWGMFFGQPVSSLPPCWARGRGLGVGSWERRVLEAEGHMSSSWQPHKPSLRLQEQWVSGPPWAEVRVGDQG